MKNDFNEAAKQVFKDTVNGFNHTTPLGIFHMVATALTSWNTLSYLSWGVVPLVPAIFAAICYGSAWHNGKQAREAGQPPRYIK